MCFKICSGIGEINQDSKGRWISLLQVTTIVTVSIFALHLISFFAKGPTFTSPVLQGVMIGAAVLAFFSAVLLAIIKNEERINSQQHLKKYYDI
jgi:hypothetical protein